MTAKRSHRSQNDTSKSTTPQSSSHLQARSFTPSVRQGGESAAELKAVGPEAEALVQQSGFSFANIAVGGDGVPPPSLPSPLQAKLTIGQPNDPYEQEADRVAREVVQQIHSPQVQASSPPEEEELQMKAVVQAQTIEEEELQMKAMDGQSFSGIRLAPTVPPISLISRAGGGVVSGEASSEFETTLNRARSGGESLAPQTKGQMESAMGADFSGVKVHTDAVADQLSQSIQARAFTTGQDVFFKQGEYQPGSRGGQELLAHELTHVVQQSGGAVRRSPSTNHNHAIQCDIDHSASPSLPQGSNNWKDIDDEANERQLNHTKEDYLFDQSLKSPEGGVTPDERAKSLEASAKTQERLAEQSIKVKAENDVPWPPSNAFFFWKYQENPDKAVQYYIKGNKLIGTPNQIATIHARAKHKENIPKLESLLNPDQIASHLGKFANGAHAFIDPTSSKKIENEITDARFKGWGVDTNFVAPLDEANDLNAKAHKERGIETIEEALGIPGKYWSKSAWNPEKYLVRWIIPKPKLKLDDNDGGILLEMATGTEWGADSSLWVAGGLTKGGASEAILKAIPREQLIKMLAKGTIRQKKEYYPETRDNIE